MADTLSDEHCASLDSIEHRLLQLAEQLMLEKIAEADAFAMHNALSIQHPTAGNPSDFE